MRCGDTAAPEPGYSLLTSSVAGARVEYDERKGRGESKELREVGGEDGRGRSRTNGAKIGPLFAF